MGNANSSVTDGVKAQAGTSTQKLYKLVDLKGGGILVELTKQATATKNYAALDEAINARVPPLLYNDGEGKLMHVSEIVLFRNKCRPKHKQLLKNEADYANYQPPDDKDPSMYKLVCWKMDERGAVGETCLHLCLLNATAVHSELAKRLIRFFPKLINDVYESDEYYGENALHMAIVNEDFPMVKFLLDSGIDVHQRCSGAFMGPEDQKASRADNLKHEWVDRDLNTNYAGHAYWGEYPAAFSACLSQEECYRIILAKGADPDAQDTNGNTVLHVLVIYNKMQMFDLAYELGTEVNIKNFLNLTPLTLAAKLARKDMFFHILNIEREIYWQIGSVTCAAYPLTKLDTIDMESGGIQKESALNLIVFGEKVDHLDLMEGPVIDLLQAKWNTFVKFRFYKQFIMFFIYFSISLSAFISRPTHRKGISNKPSSNSSVLFTGINSTFLYQNQSSIENFNGSLVQIMNLTTLLAFPGNITEMVIYDTGNFSALTGGNDTLIPGIAIDWVNGSELPNANGVIISSGANGTLKNGTSKLFTLLFGWSSCMQEPTKVIDWIRLICEGLMLLGSISFILGAWRECQFLGASMFFENLATAPSRVMFLMSCHLVILMAVLRFLCMPEIEDIVALCIMMTTAPYFLFFCRGFKTVGPFVVMIYRMLSGDLLRFVIIYLIFVMGFSQAYYVIFLSFKNPPQDNPLGTPAESIVAMFMVSLSSFDNTYENFKFTDHEIVAKLLFVIYMAIVAILLINMLIAMMGNTYTKIAETKNEWQRQWARIVLVVERGVHPKERLIQQGIYSQPMGDAFTRALVLRLNQSEDEKEEMKEMMDLKRYHDKSIQRRLNKLMATRASIPRHSIANSLLGVSMNN